MTEEGREWLNSYKEIDLYLSTSRGEKTKGTSVEGDITELIDVIKAVEGAEMLKTILMEHIEVVVRGTNHRFVRLEAERRLNGNEDIGSPLEVDIMEAKAKWEKMNGKGLVNQQIPNEIENVGALSRGLCRWTRKRSRTQSQPAKRVEKMWEKQFAPYMKEVERLDAQKISAIIEGRTENTVTNVPIPALIWFAVRKGGQDK